METLRTEYERAAPHDSGLLRWYAIEVDETGYWMFEKLEKAILERFGTFHEEWSPRIVARYVPSPDIGVHICSFERMAEAYFIESTPVWENDVPDLVREFVMDWIMSGDESEPVSYFEHRRFFDGVTGLSGPNFKFIGATRTADSGEELEDLLDHERCNPSF